MKRKRISAENENSLERKCEKGQLDAFGLYLYGLVLNAKQNKNEARKVLLESVKRNLDLLNRETPFFSINLY